MELRHLRYFVTVAGTQSVSRAAAQLRISQPALSRQIHDLEADLGLKLFDRVGRGLRLTAEAEDLLQRCRDLLAAADSLSDRARAMQGGHIGVLRIGATPQTLESILAGFLVRWRQDHPTIDVQLFEDSGPRLLRRVEQGELHLALTVTGSERLQVRLLFPAWVLAVMAASHRLRRGATVEIQELASQPLLLLHRDFRTRQWFDAACQVAHVGQHVLLESGAPHTLVALARTGCGVAIVPSNLRLARAGLRLAPILLDGKPIGGWLAVNWDPRRFLPPYAKTFIQELAEATRYSYPGKEFEGVAPPVPRPDRDQGGRRPEKSLGPVNPAILSSAARAAATKEAEGLRRQP